MDYPLKDTKLWIPSKICSRPITEYKAIKTAFMLEKFLLSQNPCLDHLEDEERTNYKKGIKAMKTINKKLLERIEKELKPK